ncbi:hypothetical protein ACQ4LE_007873 [Meloidogyne hapla]|uniref:IRS-type PTB domain-containing protein n=1 Tax=Meloidogyne hapla TaxID=6305 RepID=A0A1I8BFI6_MELHA
MYTNATMVCSVRTGTPRGRFEAPMPIPLCEKIKPIKLPLPSKVLQHYPNSKEETFMVGFQRPSCCCCFKRKQKPQFMRTIFVSTVSDKLLLIYDKEQNKGKKKKKSGTSTREGYSFKISSATSVKIVKNALISKMSKYTNQDEHHCILEISFKFGMVFIGMDGEKIISEWCPVLLCAFEILLISPTSSAPCDALASSTNIAPKLNVSKAAFDENNEQRTKTTPDSSLPPRPVSSDVSSPESKKDVTHKSFCSDDIPQKPKKKRAKKKTKKKKSDEPKKKETSETALINDVNAVKEDSFASIVDDEKKLDKQEKNVSGDISSKISKNNEQKQQEGDRMERWFSNSEDSSKLSVDTHEAASGPLPAESPKKLSDTSLSEIGPPLATSSLADVNSTNNDNFNVAQQHEEFIFSRVCSHNNNDAPSMSIQQPATKFFQQYLPKQQKHHFVNFASSNSSYVPMNENKEEGSYSITSCISTSEQRTSPEPDCGYQFTWVPKHLNEEEMMIVKEEIEKKTKQLPSRQFVGEPSSIQHISRTTYCCNKPSISVEPRKGESRNWRPDDLLERKGKNKSVPIIKNGKDVPPPQSDDTLQRPFPLQKAKKVTAITPIGGSVNKTPKQVRWLSPRREFNDIPRPYQVAPIRQTSSSLGYIVRRYGFNDDIIGSGCVYDGGDTSTQLQHFGPLGSEVAIREHGQETSNHQLLNVRKLFEQRINAFLDKNSGGAINGNNLAAIAPAKDTLEPVTSALDLNNKKSKMETNNCRQPKETELKIDNKEKCWPVQQKSNIPEKYQRPPPPPPLLLRRPHVPSTRAQRQISESNA